MDWEHKNVAEDEDCFCHQSEFFIVLSQNLDVISWLAPTCNRRNTGYTFSLYFLLHWTSFVLSFSSKSVTSMCLLDLLFFVRVHCRQSHQKSKGNADPVMHMSCMTTATVLRGDELLLPLKNQMERTLPLRKRMERTLTNTARPRPVCHIPFARLHRCMDLLTPRSSQSSVPSF